MIFNDAKRNTLPGNQPDCKKAINTAPGNQPVCKKAIRFIATAMFTGAAITFFLFTYTHLHDASAHSADSVLLEQATTDIIMTENALTSELDVFSERGIDIWHSAAVGSSVAFAGLAYGLIRGPLVITPYPWLSYIFACLASAASAGLGVYGGTDTWEWFEGTGAHADERLLL